MEWQGKLERERQECEASKIQELTLLEEQLSEIKLRNTLLSEKLMNTENNVRYYNLKKNIEIDVRGVKIFLF